MKLRWLLSFAETFYLYGNGWKKNPDGGDDWIPGPSYPYRVKSSYTKGHAVNAQKLQDEETRRLNRTLDK